MLHDRARVDAAVVKAAEGARRKRGDCGDGELPRGIAEIHLHPADMRPTVGIARCEVDPLRPGLQLVHERRGGVGAHPLAPGRGPEHEAELPPRRQSEPRQSIVTIARRGVNTDCSMRYPSRPKTSRNAIASPLASGHENSSSRMTLPG